MNLTRKRSLPLDKLSLELLTQKTCGSETEGELGLKKSLTEGC